MTGRLDVHAIHVDQVARQPQRQRHEGAEHEEVVKSENRQTCRLLAAARTAAQRATGALAPAPAPRSTMRRVVLRGQDTKTIAPITRTSAASPAVGHASPADPPPGRTGRTNLVTAAPTLPARRRCPAPCPDAFPAAYQLADIGDADAANDPPARPDAQGPRPDTLRIGRHRRKVRAHVASDRRGEHLPG